MSKYAREKENKDRVICSAKEWCEKANERTKDTSEFDVKRIGFDNSGGKEAGGDVYDIVLKAACFYDRSLGFRELDRNID